MDVGINRNMKLIIAKTIPPNMIAAIPYVAMIAPPNIAPAIVPAFAAVRKCTCQQKLDTKIPKIVMET